MKKRVLSVLLITVIVSSIFTGCGKKESSVNVGNSNDVTVEVEKEEITEQNTEKEDSFIENFTQELEDAELFESKSDIASYEDVEELLGQEIASGVEVDGVKYRIYENGAEVSNTGTTISNVIKEEVEYEGNTYLVISMNCELGYQDTESFEVPSHIKYIYPKITNTYAVKNITIPETVEYFIASSKGTAGGDSALESITFPDNLNTDKAWRDVFSYCYNLKSVIIPEGVESLEETFKYCNSLESVSIPSSVKKICGNTFMDCFALSEVIIPEGVEKIDSAFCGSSITSLSIPSSVKEFNLYIYSCNNLEELIIPETVEVISGRNEIDDCKNLKRIEINGGDPNSSCNLRVSDCPALETIICPDNISGLSINNDDISNIVIYVPENKVDEFKEKYPEYNIVAKD